MPAWAGVQSTALLLCVYHTDLLHWLSCSVTEDNVADLQNATDLSFAAQAQGKAMSCLRVLERHFWLNLTHLPDHVRVSLKAYLRPLWGQ